MPGIDYVNTILTPQRTLLDKEIEFLKNEGTVPIYNNLEDPGDYAHFIRDVWESTLISQAFTDKNFANIGQSVYRRNIVDSLLCIERAMIMYEYSREDFYDQELQQVSQNRKLVDTEETAFITTVDTAYVKVQ